VRLARNLLAAGRIGKRYVTTGSARP